MRLNEPDVSRHFVDEARRIFGFLSTEYGFSLPTTTRDEQFGITRVAFKGHHVAVECVWDPREQFVGCDVIALVNGKIPPACAVFEGRRVRKVLTSYLVERGLRKDLFRQRKILDPAQRITGDLEDNAAMLRKHGQEVLADLPDFHL